MGAKLWQLRMWESDWRRVLQRLDSNKYQLNTKITRRVAIKVSKLDSPSLRNKFWQHPCSSVHTSWLKPFKSSAKKSYQVRIPQKDKNFRRVTRVNINSNYKGFKVHFNIWLKVCVRLDREPLNPGFDSSRGAQRLGSDGSPDNCPNPFGQDI